MNKLYNKQLVTIIILFTATIGFVLISGRPKLYGGPGVREKLPNNMGKWTGYDINFCRDTQCNHQFMSGPAESSENIICPMCEGSSDKMSTAEKNILPEDTVIIRKLYKHPIYQSITVTIVISGTRRSSIHRPEWCLGAAGYTIRERSIKVIPIQNRQPLKVQTLNIVKGQGNIQPYQYIYWFLTDSIETPYQLQRLMLMANDNLFKGISRRWAYISVMTAQSENNSKTVINEFIPMLYQEIAISSRHSNH